MTANDLAKVIAQAQAQGAPEWGVTLIVQQHELREAFLRHCEIEEERRKPWKAIRQKLLEYLVVGLVIWLLMQAPAILKAAP